MLVGGTLGAALGNAVPDPGDVVYILGQRWLTEHYKQGKISEGWLWAGELGVYYIPSALWWALVSLLAYKAKGIKTKVAVVGGVVSAGVAVSLIANYIIKAK
ncbi:Uncharacterised protein [uncultured archaeon]|nr:Uncharacterised protein [uncultured archaeon]